MNLLLQTNSHNGLPEYLCYQCLAYVRKFKKFRDKCQRTYYALQEVLHRNKEVNFISSTLYILFLIFLRNCKCLLQKVLNNL